jgi:hypothetical protein
MSRLQSILSSKKRAKRPAQQDSIVASKSACSPLVAAIQQGLIQHHRSHAQENAISYLSSGLATEIFCSSAPSLIQSQQKRKVLWERGQAVLQGLA